MKCLQEIKTGEIVRVEDKAAYNMVGTQWKFTSKTEWKKQNRKPSDEVVTDKKKKTEKKVK
jgi:hypothetical protein